MPQKRLILVTVLPHPAVMIQLTKISGGRCRIQSKKNGCMGRYMSRLFHQFFPEKLRLQPNRRIIMMMHKKLQKILAIALMTSFFSTSFLMGVSEAAPARHAGGQRPPQTQQVRPVHKSSSGHQARPAMHRSNPGHHGPAVRKNIPKQQGSGMHRSTQHHKAQPVMHKSGPAHHGSITRRNL